MTTGLAIQAILIVRYAALAVRLGRWSITMLASVVFILMALQQFQAAGRAVDTLVAAATWTILLRVAAPGLSAVLLSVWYAHRLEAAIEPPVDMAGASELRPRRSVLAGSPQRQHTRVSRFA
jgi:hypothetical protein